METKIVEEVRQIPARDVLSRLESAMERTVKVAELNCAVRSDLKLVWLRLAVIRHLLTGSVFSVTMYDGENWDSRDKED